MKLGIFVGNQYTAEGSLYQKIEESLEVVRAARDSGFDLIAAGEHYLSHPYRMPNCFPYLARLAPEAGGMMVAATIILLPLHNPVDVADSVATLDGITDGKFIFGVGIGYRDDEYAAFGIPRNERVPRMLESLKVMKMLWTQEEVEYQGKFYNVPKSKPTSFPTQKPYPPIWIAANHDKAIMRAARHGYPWVINPHATVSMIKDQVGMYRKAAQDVGTPLPEHLPMMREMYIAEDKETALKESAPYLASKYEAYISWGQDKALPGNENWAAASYEQLSQDRFLVGDPEHITNEILRYEQELGATHMLFRMQWPGMDYKQVIKELELISKRVMPKLKK